MYIGIDPSSASTGYAVIDADKVLLDYGTIKGRADDPASFVHTYDVLQNLFDRYAPEGVFIEDQFFSKNASTLKKIVRPTGFILLLVGQYDVPYQLVAPATWRKAFNGKGNASKKDSYALACEYYPGLFDSFNKYNDITDAIGLAHACVEAFESHVED